MYQLKMRGRLLRYKGFCCERCYHPRTTRHMRSIERRDAAREIREGYDDGTHDRPE